jgi:hypothetical protein
VPKEIGPRRVAIPPNQQPSGITKARNDSLELAPAAQVRLELGEHAKHVDEALAVGVPVSIGCSVALSQAPRATAVRRMSCISPMPRAKRSLS